jgi:TolB protein
MHPPRPLPLAIAALACALAGLSGAQEATAPRIIGRTEGQAARVRIALPDPAPGAGAGAAAAEILSTLRDDLEFTGLFDIVDPSLYRLAGPDDGDKPRHGEWLSIGADALVRSRVAVTGGRVDLQAWLYDNASGNALFARRYGGSDELRRLVAHQLADDLVRHYTGEMGVALTRIAFVSRHRDGKEIYLMDYDGRRARRLTTTGTLNLSPAWSPDGDELAFVSWRGKQPGVYVMSSEGKIGSLPVLRGNLSSAPDWSPDGRRLVYSSDAAGNFEIYILERSSGRNLRLTHNGAIDTAPAFSPTGREIAFTSDRSGKPQIHVMDAEGLNARRVSW